MLPNNKLELRPYPAEFLGPRGQELAKFTDAEFGGVAINNPLQGLQYQAWNARLINSYSAISKVLLRADNLAEFEFFALPYLCDFGFSFDVNMQPAYAYTTCINYVKNSYFTFYDTKTNKFLTLDLGRAYTPRVSLDDKRFNDGFSKTDVILAYVKNKQLFIRQSRDRYLKEYHLKDDGKTIGLEKIGMNVKQRFQFLRLVDFVD